MLLPYIHILATRLLPVLLLMPASAFYLVAQPVLETGTQKPMPAAWIDKDTHHKIIKLTRTEGRNASFYFHNQPFIGNTMVFYNTGKNGRQLYIFRANFEGEEQVYAVEVKKSEV